MVGLLSSVSLFDRERGREVVGTKLSPAQRERERVESSLMVCEEEAANNSLFQSRKNTFTLVWPAARVQTPSHSRTATKRLNVGTIQLGFV